MVYQYTAYIWPFIVTILINIFMILHMLKKRRINGAVAFILTLLFSSIWCIGTLMETMAVNFATKLFWTKVGYIAYAFSPVSWMAMVMQLTDHWEWLNRRRKILLCIIPVLTVIFVWTNDCHNLIGYYNYATPNGTVPVHILKHGRWFWVHAVYSDGLNLSSIFMIIRFWKNKAPLYGKQFKYLAFSMLFVMLVNLTFVLKIGPKIDTTSIAWGISSFFIMWALYRNKLFDLIPIARNRVMENMTDSIVILDLQNRIVGMNPSANSFFQCNILQGIGDIAAEFFKPWPYLLKTIMGGGNPIEFEAIQNNQTRYYEATCLPLKNEREVLLGKLLVIRDITEKEMTKNELSLGQQEIAIKDERERIAEDLHDNIGQIMGYVNVQTQAIKEYLKNNQVEAAEECLVQLTEVSQQAHNTVRKAILSMREETVRIK